MKNKLLKAATLFCVVTVLGACNKDKSTGPNQNADSMQTSNPIERLRTFRKQIENAKLGARSDETITLSDALWGIENNFNLTYSDVESYYSKVNDHEFELSLPVNAEQNVLINDVVTLYSQVIEQARDAYLTDELDEKGFLSLSIKEVEDENGMMRISFSGKIGEKTNYNPPVLHIEGPFGDDDDWLFAAPLGKCDDPDIPSGADEQLQENLYVELIEPLVKNATAEHRVIFVDRKHFVFDGSNYGGIYYNPNIDNTCIDHQYMNDYYSGEKRVITQTIPERYHLVGYSPVSIVIRGTFIESPEALTHSNEVEYGIRTEVRTYEFGDVESLVQ